MQLQKKLIKYALTEITQVWLPRENTKLNITDLFLKMTLH